MARNYYFHGVGGAFREGLSNISKSFAAREERKGSSRKKSVQNLRMPLLFMV